MMRHRRFIAGAVCAACGATDRIVVESAIDGQRQRCVVCGQTQLIRNVASMDTDKAQRPALIASSRATISVDSDAPGRLSAPSDYL
jgi:uncharacterized metal-binding protein (TIGR02443 family)